MRMRSIVSLSLTALLGVLGAIQADQVLAADNSTLVFGRGADSVTLDPAGATDGESFSVTDHIFNNLVTFKSGSTDIRPDLAEKWDVNSDGTQYVFYLHPGVKFHDDTPLDAAAVVYSFMRQKDKSHEAFSWGGPYGYFSSMGFDSLIKSIEAVNPTTVKFTLTRPDATFLSSLGMQSFAIVSPTALRKYKKDFGRHPVGSGPFMFAKWKEKELVLLKANPNYWSAKPKLATLIFRAIPDSNARMMEFVSKRIQVMDNPNPSDIGAITSKMGPSVVMAQQAGFNLAYLAINNDKPQFKNQKVRLAIAQAINKDALIKSVYQGYGQKAINPMPPTLWGYNKSVTDYKYDPEAAKKLLAEAGFPNGFETTLWAMPVSRPYMPDGRKAAESIQGDLAKIGIKVKIVSYDWGTYLDKTGNGEHDLAILGWTGDIGDPDNFLYVLLDKDNVRKPASNTSFYQGEEVHKLLTEARRLSDQGKRAELYRKAQEIIHRDVPMVPLAHSVDVVPVTSGLQGFTLDPTGRRRFAEAYFK